MAKRALHGVKMPENKALNSLPAYTYFDYTVIKKP